VKLEETKPHEVRAVRSLSPEDLRCGDFVAIVHETVEYPSFWWHADAHILPPCEAVRIRCHTDDCGLPLKIKAICLPFVFVKKPCGQYRTLDVRQQKLARLAPDYARPVWKALNKQSRPQMASSL
jgi:hypothetical protein